MIKLHKSIQIEEKMVRKKILWENMSKINLHMEIETHKKVKILAAALGKSIREVITGWINEKLQEEYPKHAKLIQKIENSKFNP